MKLSKETIGYLKNFATINGNLLIKPGSALSTISAAKSVYAAVNVTENFEHQFGIYDLNEFLGILSLFEDPDIQFTPTFATIRQGKNSLKFFSADSSVLTAPAKAIKLPPADVSFELEEAQVTTIIKAIGVLRAPDIIIKGADGILKIIVGDKKNSAASSQETEIGETDKEFTANINVNNFKIIPGRYTCGITGAKAAQFVNGDLQYLVSLESDSTF